MYYIEKIDKYNKCVYIRDTKDKSLDKVTFDQLNKFGGQTEIYGMIYNYGTGKVEKMQACRDIKLAAIYHVKQVLLDIVYSEDSFNGMYVIKGEVGGDVCEYRIDREGNIRMH